MKFRKFGKTVLTAALGSAIIFSLSSCVQSFTSGYLYVTGTVTATPAGNGIISGFKIDNNTGKLTAIHGLPTSSGGANPVRAVLIPGGRFVYVLNRGTTASGGSDCTAADPCPNANITQFAVGGNGILTPQLTFFTQGINPFRLLTDTSGNYLIALDQEAPAGTYCSTVVAGATSCGDITIFHIDGTTGRPSLVTNAQLTSSTGTSVTYFPVPANPVDFVSAAGYIFTLSGTAGAKTGQIVYPYGYNSTTGQLTVSQSTPQILNNGSGGLLDQGSAIVYAGGKVYVLDNEPLSATVTINGVTTTTSTPSQILQFTVGTNGALQSLTGGAVQDDPSQSSPIYLILESKNKFVYVANQLGSGISSGSGIAGFTIDPASGILIEDGGSPWGTGSNPQCLLEDPSNQFLYTANGDSTVSGRVISPNTGDLSNMHGSTGSFPLLGPATWCFASGRTN
jgi:6-phosphogluconolactonase (cycloisomerase 2 family)